MKQLFTTGIMILCLFDFGQIHSQSITLTFSGVKDGQPVMLNSIVIQNLDKACDTTLYYPDTSLTLQLLGIGDHPLNPSGFTVFQNVPNPAGSHTTISVYQPVTGEVSVKVTELTGRQVASFTGELNRGYHVFDFMPGSADFYVFSAGCSGLTRSIMIVSATSGGNGLCMLKYAGNTPEKQVLKSAIPAGGFTFYLGDHLRFTGHHDIDTAVIGDALQGNMDYTFDFSGGSPCPGIPTFTDPRDGKVYPTVQIGSQSWLRKNMNYQTGNSWCFNDSTAYCDISGRLYDWETALGVCPSGWHLPNDTEWCTMTQFIDPTVNCDTMGSSGTDAGINMKSTSGWISGGNGTNASGFTALPGSFRFDGYFSSAGRHNAYFWSSSEYSTSYAWSRYLAYVGEGETRTWTYYKTFGFIVRCLQN